MSEDLKFAEEGLKIQEAITHAMEGAMAAAAVGTAVGGPTVGAVIAFAAFVLELMNFLGGDDEQRVIDALNKLQRQINEIKAVLVILDERLDELVPQVANAENRATLRSLLDYLDQIRVLEGELKDRPADVDVAVRVANEAGIVCDKFLRNDYDIWRWSEVVLKAYRDQNTGQMRNEPAVSTLRFKNVPTLPVYIVAVMTWLAARERVVEAGQRARLTDDVERLDRHATMTAVRPNFDKYDDGPDGVPKSIAEQIKWRIRGYVLADDKYANRDKMCTFHFQVGSMMDGKSAMAEGFTMAMAEAGALCTVNPKLIGSPQEEYDLEAKSGCAVLEAFSEALARLRAGGSLRTQYVGTFPNTTAYAPATIYLVDLAGAVQWLQLAEASRPGGPDRWTGPKEVRSDLAGYSRVLNGGGPAIYAMKPTGELIWYSHDAHFSGDPQWRGPVQVGHGWQGFRHVFGGGEYVIYAVQQDGRLLWYRHDGAPWGGDVSTWAGAREVSTGFGGYDHLMSPGEGLIFGIRPDGVLVRHRHLGFADGSNNWEPAKHIGTGWQNFRAVVAAPDGVFLAFTTNGRVLWYRYGSRRTRYVTRPGGGRIPISVSGDRWEGPVEIRNEVPAFAHAFAVLATPYRGPR